MSDHQTAGVILILIDAVAFIAAALIARAIRHFGERPNIRPFRWGVGGVILLSAFLTGIVLRVLSRMPGSSAANGMQNVDQHMIIGRAIGHAVVPGLIVIVVAWGIARARRHAAGTTADGERG